MTQHFDLIAPSNLGPFQSCEGWKFNVQVKKLCAEKVQVDYSLRIRFKKEQRDPMGFQV